jgi:putative glutamine amidotransferase
MVILESDRIRSVEEFILDASNYKREKDIPVLLLPGGGDVDSIWYGMRRHPTMYGVQRELDAFEFALLAAADWLRIPVVGICRGMQLIAVYHGIKLVQDIPERHPTYHRVEVHEHLHPLDRYLRAEEYIVNSLHHQGVAVDTLPSEAICIASFNGIVEAMQIGNKVGVQFHPELMKEYDLFLKTAVEAALSCNV